MSENNWETQPRKTNGEFTFRHKKGLVEIATEKMMQEVRDKNIKQVTRGGSYGYLRGFVAGNKSFHIHHMPAASVSPLSRWKGPCIIMGVEDHKKTSSYGRSKKAQRFRRWQAKLISEGKFLEAELMDIKNIERKFGDKYNNSIEEKKIYEEQLIKEGVIYG